ncbi:hypothetical protein GCM10011575_01770 [Microlunatus endophyticus]|uniref:PDZ domain-containing protein n=1 Tax=Microlunatus endophyticus TaxID=1716077 RepID=A0A917RZU4_9ACTN|nr:trypsin-like peptidase domain-containing protein [Microlunatus endophyticus]GGL47553.1 hypothetical protein GCM10011575_01770 [Microlunatus endophyticus]
MSENGGSGGSDRPDPGSFQTPARPYDNPDRPQFRPDFHSPYQNPPPYQQPPGYGPFGPTARPTAPPSIQQAPLRPATRPRSAGILVIAAVLAVLLGGGAGYLGARLGTQQQSGTAAPAASAPAPSAPAPHPKSATSSEPSAAAPTAASAPKDSGSPIPPGRGSADTVRIAARMLPSTVTIEVSVGSEGELGSGFVLDDDGRIMTNNHVVADAADGGSIMVTFSDGHRSRAEILGRSPSYDLAVIQVADHAGLHPADLGDSDRTKVGEPAIAIGSPLGLGGTVTEGIVSAIDRPVAVGDPDSSDGQAYLNAIQTDAPINHGNSGGPLVNGDGEVIGVDSAILTGSSSASGQESGNIGIGFAIPINQARQIAALLIKDGHATYPVIDATVTSDGSDSGVRLSKVVRGGAADEAGLRADDVITAIDGKRVAESEDLIVAIRTHRPGDVVRLEFRRNGSSHTVQVRLGSKRG